MAEYIEREAAKRAIQTALNDGTGYGEALNAIPAADVRPVVRGRWELVKEPFGAGYVKCSVCAYTHCPPYKVDGSGITHNFCPNCGAKMEVQDG